jgi:hypothetical protein
MNNQIIYYRNSEISVNILKDTIFIKNKNGLININLSAFLLKLDPTFTIDQYISHKEEVGIINWKKLRKLLMTNQLKCDFFPSNLNLYVILETKFNKNNYSYLFDVSNHFYIKYKNNLNFYSILFNEITNIEDLPECDTNNDYLKYIITLINRF